MSGNNSANKGTIVKVSETSHSVQDVFIEIKKRFWPCPQILSMCRKRDGMYKYIYMHEYCTVYY
jgi:hypothetical protein